jgi:hypothetical protein
VKPSKQWLDSMTHLWKLERGARLNELRGKRVRPFDDSGCHPQSLLWGQVRALEGIEPHLRVFGSHPTELRSLAKRAAEEAFRNEVLLGAIATGEVTAPEEVAA